MAKVLQSGEFVLISFMAVGQLKQDKNIIHGSSIILICKDTWQKNFLLEIL